MASVITYAQEDTLHISTDKRDGIVFSRYYVINDSQFMIVHYNKEKNDTIMEDSIPEYYQEHYKREVRIRDIKKKDVSKIDADEVFDYFFGLTEEELLQKLSNKMVAVDLDGSYQVAFFNKFSKKNEVFSFKIWDGKVSRISRPSTNTLPTNDVWTAFQIIQLKEYLGDMEALIQQLRKKYPSSKIKK
ncbi:MAG: hypothetical protein KIG42_06630 [Paludibacteraceae bacterium]|nr:hypothetical protein [Paludibacteraceae bacterium]